MKDEDFENRKKNLAKGKHYHALVHGVLGWGLPMFVMTIFVFPMLEVGGFSYWYLVLLILVIFASGGLAVYCIKLLIAKQYLKALAWSVPLVVAASFLITELHFVPPPKDKIIISFFVWGIGGYFFGLSLWSSLAKQHRKELLKREAEGNLS